jgi:hypothetical protein
MTPSRLGRRILVVAAALAIGTAGIVFLVSAFRSGGEGSAAASDVVRVSCQDDITKLEDAEVNVQPDGVHVSMEADFDQPVVTFFPEGSGGIAHGLGPDFNGRSDRFVIPIPPGDVAVECGPKEVGEPSDNAVSLHLTDPAGVWHDPTLACGTDITEWGSVAFYYVKGNPFPEAVYRTLPGLRSDDVVAFGGYPEDPNGAEPVVIRNGEVIGAFNLSTYDQRTFIVYGVFCNSSGVDEPPAGDTDTTSTPFHLPDIARCDPYAESCASVYLSAARYEELTGDAPKLVKAIPMANCDRDIPGTCVPDAQDMIVRVVTNSDDAEQFIDEHGCGATEDTACT